MNRTGEKPAFFCPQCSKKLPRRKRYCIFCSFDLSTMPGYFESSTLPAGFVLGRRYRVVQYVTSGGMAHIYRVEDGTWGREYCLKEMMDNFLKPEDRESAVARFQREAAMLSALRHPSIPRIIDHFVDGNRYYLVMDYIKGKDLETILREDPSGRIAQEKVTAWLYRIIDVLGYLHGQDPPVVYRDLKPSNILADEEGRIYLIDFGIARILQPDAKGTLIGTPGYAPPEQYKGQVDHRSDIYALGATLHHLLTGKDPREEIPFNFAPIKDLLPGMDDALANIVGQSLEYSVDRRPQSVAQIYPMLGASRMAGDGAKFYGEGMFHLRGGKPEEAEEAFTRSIQACPGQAYAHFMRGMARIDLGNPAGAVEDMEKAALLQPDNPDVHYNLGLLYSEDSLWDKAVRCLQKAVLASPGFIEAMESLEKARRKKEEMERKKLFDQTTGEEGDPRKAHYKLAMYFLTFERFVEAEAEFGRALKMSPGDPEIWQGLGSLHASAGRHRQALDCFCRALELSPSMLLLHRDMAGVHLKAGQPGEAWKQVKAGIARAMKSAGYLDSQEFRSLLQSLIDVMDFMGRDSREKRDVQAALDSGEGLGKAFPPFYESLGEKD